MGCMDRRQRYLPLTAVALFFLSSLSPVSSFFSAFVPNHASPTSCAHGSTRSATGFRTGHAGGADAGGGSRSTCCARARGGLVMERPSGKFNRLAKPPFDRDNPNAVLGEVTVPGLQQVSRALLLAGTCFCKSRPILTLVCCTIELVDHNQLHLWWELLGSKLDRQVLRASVVCMPTCGCLWPVWRSQNDGTAKRTLL